MDNFSNHNEKEFLEGYVNFSVEIRPFIIKKLCEAYRYHIDKDEKEILRLLIIEQFFLLFETLEGFLKAIKDRKFKPLLDSLTKDFNIQNLNEQLKGKDADGILKMLDIDISKFELNIQNEIKERFIKMVGLFQEDNFCKAIKYLVPAFNALKHRTLVYKNKKGETAIVLNEKAEK